MSVRRVDSGQGVLFPRHLGDWVPEDHPARLVDDFVDALEIPDFDAIARQTGAPAYPPRLMLKVILYARHLHIPSSRRIATACAEHLVMRWLAGGAAPDFRTISRFQNDHRPAIVKFHTEMILLLAEAEIVSGSVVAIDGTKIRGAASRRSLVDRDRMAALVREAELAAASIAAEIAANDEVDGTRPDSAGERLAGRFARAEGRAAALKDALARMETSGSKNARASSTDPESVVVRTREGAAGPGYNVQAAIDVGSRIVVAVDVVADTTDNAHLIPMVHAAADATGALPGTVLADAGYTGAETLVEAEAIGVVPLIPQLTNPAKPAAQTDGTNAPVHPQTGKLLELDHHGRIHWSEFEERPDADGNPSVAICPAGRELTFTGVATSARRNGSSSMRGYASESCAGCPLAAHCLLRKSGRKRGRRSRKRDAERSPGPRRVRIPVHRDAILRARDRLLSADGRKLYGERWRKIEPAFGWQKHLDGFRQATVWGTDRVRTQALLVFIARNMRTVIGRVGVLGMREVIRRLRPKVA